MKRIIAVTGTSIKETKIISWQFMFDSNLPVELGGDPGAWGYLALKSKDDNYFDPWKWAKGEECIGDDGVPRWEIFLFRGGEGQIYTASGNDSENNHVLKKMIRNIPNCCILMHRACFDRFNLAYEEVSYELERSEKDKEKIEFLVHHYDGELSTD